MKMTVNLEGSDEDIGKLLVSHQIITEKQLEQAWAQFRAPASGEKPKSIRDVLTKSGIIPSSLTLEVLRVSTKVHSECSKCGAAHQIYYYHPDSKHACSICGAPLAIREEGKAPAVVRAPDPPPVAKNAPPSRPLQKTLVDLTATVMSLPDADHTMLDLGPSKKSPAASASTPPAAASAAPPPPPPGAPRPLPDLSNTAIPLPTGQTTILDMGAAKRPGQPPAPAPLPGEPRPLPDLGNTIMSLPDAGQTMLDMGTTPRTGSTKPAPLPGAPPPLPDLSNTVMSLPDAGQTMLGMGDTPRTASTKPAPLPGAPPPLPDLSNTVMSLPDAGQTMLDMGATPKPLPGERHSITSTETDLGTIVLGETPPTPKGAKGGLIIEDTPRSSTKGGTVRPGERTETVMPTGTSKTASMTGSGISDVTATVRQTTPKTPGDVVGIAAPKLPADVGQAAKDPNRVFGKYVLMKELGRGGAGVVFKAWDTLLSQYVALKFIRDQGMGDSDSTSGSQQVAEFQREARMSVKLRHPNIVRIYELGCMSNRYYLSMEYIEGGSLLEVIHGGKERNLNTCFNSNKDRFLKIMMNISMGVDYAHRLSPPVVHRDLKPHNVLVDKSGNPYVVDFGLAKEVETGDNATLTGVVKGTPTYMAPEQAAGRNREIDQRTDVYSLGAIMYEMLTGRPPFTAESVPELLHKIATEIPERPNQLIMRLPPDPKPNPNRPVPIPKPLETICLKALEKNRIDRYQSAKEFADDIERYTKNEDILATEPGLWRRIRRKIRQRPLVSGMVAAVMLTALASTIVAKVVRPAGGEEIRKAITASVEAAEKDLKDQKWEALEGDIRTLSNQAPNDSHLPAFRKALSDHRELVKKTQAEWKDQLRRISKEPLKNVLRDLRETFGKVPELQPELRVELNGELTKLHDDLVKESRKVIGSAKVAWVEELIKQGARDTQDQVHALASLAGDADFPFATDAALEETREGLARVIAYQGTWTLQVNVAPFAEVLVRQVDKEVTTDYTPIGLPELEVLGSSYTVEICWPSRANPKVRMTEEIKDLKHNQVVVIRGDISKSNLKQERK